MPKLTFQIAMLVRPLDDGCFLGEPLLFPEFCCHGRTTDEVRRNALERVGELLDATLPAELHRRQLAGELDVVDHQITIDPPKRSALWTTPAILNVPYVTWRHGSDALVAYIPQLQLEIVAQTTRKLEERLDEEIDGAMIRSRALAGLDRLVWFEREEGLELDLLTLQVDVPTPRETARRLVMLEEQKTAVLKEVAVNLTRKRRPPAYEVDEQVARLGECLASGQRTNVLLVGPSGVGKTAIVHEMVSRRRDLGLGDFTFWSTSGSRIVAGMSGFGMWQQRCQQLTKELAQGKTAMHWGNLPELMEVGKSSCSQSIATFLRPYFARRTFCSLAECTADQLASIERNDPQLLDVFYRLDISEASQPAGRRILEQHVAEQKPATMRFDGDALDKVDRLHRRFATYSAFPGRPLRFIKNLLQDRLHVQRVAASDVTEMFSRETGLPRFLLDDDTHLDVEETHRWFCGRVIGQPQAVDRIVDVLASVKADLGRSGRPIASFLFAGPTGVGKTEMAKAICQFMYADPRRMVRFDMSEYSDPASVHRLIGGLGTTRGLLTDRVREQPFTVVLLDEFEKAHPLFFDTLLQVLGEGRLTDAAGRLTDFCNSIVILTSNLGADSFGKGTVGLTQQLGQQAADHFLRKIREFVRPEFFNRLEHVIPFAPLDRASIEIIAAREVEKLRARDGLRYRQLAMNLDEEVIPHLAERGTDPRYGARPLKRRLERFLVTPLAEKVNKYHGDTPLESRVQIADDRIEVSVRAVNTDRDQQVIHDELQSLERASAVRRRTHLLGESRSIRDLQNQVFRLEQRLARMDQAVRRRAGLAAAEAALAAKAAQARSPVEGEPPRSGAKKLAAELRKTAVSKELLERRQMSHDYQMAQINGQLDEIRKLLEGAAAVIGRGRELEEDALLRFYQSESLDAEQIQRDAEAAHVALEDLLMRLFLRTLDRDSKTASVAIFGVDNAPVFQLAKAYAAAASRFEVQVNWLALYAHKPTGRVPQAAFHLKYAITRDNEANAPEDPNRRRVVDVRRAGSLEDLQRLPGKELLGVGMTMQGKVALPLFEPEQGVHEFKTRFGKQLLLVETRDGRLFDYEPPEAVGSAKFYTRLLNEGYELRRRCDFESGICVDSHTGLSRLFESDFQEIVVGLICRVLSQRIEEMMTQPWT